MLSRRLKQEDGMTLAELMVVMAISSIIGAMAVAFVVTGFHANNATEQRVYNSSQARVVLDDWTALLRLADSPTDPGTGSGRFVKILPNEIVFYANLGNRESGTRSAPTKIDLSLSSGALVEKRYDPVTQALTVQRTLASGITTTSWLFRPYAGGAALSTTSMYCTSNGQSVVGYCSTTATDGSGTALGDAALEEISRIDISFNVADRNNLSNVDLTASVSVI